MVINFDANASSSLLPAVRSALLELGTDPLNASSVHRLGQRARALIEEAREEVRRLVDAPASARVLFTSGATEANNHALSFALGNDLHSKSRHGQTVVSTLVEHPSVLEPLQHYLTRGVSTELVALDASGNIDQEQFINAIGPATRLVSVMRANNETGHCFPVAALARLARERGEQALIHCDAVQALGKLPVSFRELDVDLLSVSGHKLGALAGVGALIIAERVPVLPLLRGGAQEQRWRAGTENTWGIVSLGVAAREVRSSLEDRMQSMHKNCQYLRQEISRAIPSAIINTPLQGVLPNTLSITFPGIRADDLVVALDLSGVCVSSGAACSSGKPEPSHVLRAFGMSDAEARATVRISLEPYYAAGVLESATTTIINSVMHMHAQK